MIATYALLLIGYKLYTLYTKYDTCTALPLPCGRGEAACLYNCTRILADAGCQTEFSDPVLDHLVENPAGEAQQEVAQLESAKNVCVAFLSVFSI